MSGYTQRRLSLKRKKLPQAKLADVSQAEESPHDVQLPFCGLVNLGNSCYVNSILQALRFCPGFVSAIASLHFELQNAHSNPTSSEPEGVVRSVHGDPTSSETEGGTREAQPLVTHLHYLLQKLAQTQSSHRKAALEPLELISTLKEENPLFMGYLQQDAHELLRFLMIKLHSAVEDNARSLQGPANTLHCSTEQKPTAAKRKLSLPTPGPSKGQKTSSGKRQPTNQILTEFFRPLGVTVPSKAVTSIQRRPQIHKVLSIFTGELLYQTQCFECESYTRRREAFEDITVPVTSSGLTGFPSILSSVSGGSTVGAYSLSWALDQFASRDRLTGENKYWCDCCGHLVEAERSILFSRLPQVLTVHLNRFTTSGLGLSNSVAVRKVGGNIATPLTLSLRPWASMDCPGRETVYELFAVIFHSGSSCSSGHYTTCTRGHECWSALTSGVKGQVAPDWIMFNDDVVQHMSRGDVLSMLSPLANNNTTAYILFYKTP